MDKKIIKFSTLPLCSIAILAESAIIYIAVI